MNSLGTCITPRDLPQSPKKMRMIIFVQTTRPPRSGIDLERDPQVDRPMSLVLKLAPDDLSRTQRLGLSTAFKSLNVRLFIDPNNDLAALVQSLDIFIAPKNGCVPPV